MAEKSANKIIYGGKTLIDLTGDDVTPDKVLLNIQFHSADGAIYNGTCTFDVDSSAATLKAAEALEGKTFAAGGKIVTGTGKNNGAVSGTIKLKDEVYYIPIGFHDGGGTVVIDPTEMAKLIETNIRSGVTILGVTGTMTGSEGVVSQTKTVTPTTQQQSVLPDEGYTHLSEVIVEAIPYTETENAAGGLTVTIA
ncbi:MAG: hypothetical protein ACI3ZQ_05720 [Candidatus Cryptobacteroides sp.]